MSHMYLDRVQKDIYYKNYPNHLEMQMVNQNRYHSLSRKLEYHNPNHSLCNPLIPSHLDVLAHSILLPPLILRQYLLLNYQSHYRPNFPILLFVLIAHRPYYHYYLNLQSPAHYLHLLQDFQSLPHPLCSLSHLDLIANLRIHLMI